MPLTSINEKKRECENFALSFFSPSNISITKKNNRFECTIKSVFMGFVAFFKSENKMHTKNIKKTISDFWVVLRT